MLNAMNSQIFSALQSMPQQQNVVNQNIFIFMNNNSQASMPQFEERVPSTKGKDVEEDGQTQDLVDSVLTKVIPL